MAKSLCKILKFIHNNNIFILQNRSLHVNHYLKISFFRNIYLLNFFVLYLDHN